MRALLVALIAGCAPAVDETDVAADTDSEIEADTSSDTDAGGDVGTDIDTDSDERVVSAPCTVTATRIDCAHDTTSWQIGVRRRDVHVAVPVGDAPEDGWPVAVLFQGSLVTGELFFTGDGDVSSLLYNQALVAEQLLAAGFAVVAPEARGDGGLFWDTNQPLWALNWEASPDHDLMVRLFGALDDGSLGNLDGDRLFAAGISSGGYMTSRMAVSYPGRFRALAVHSASYAICGGPLCVVPDPLPEDHPPTLFVHGGRDLVVPTGTSAPYFDQLVDQGIAADRIVEDGGHAWFPTSAGLIVDWFEAHAASPSP